MPRGLEPPNGYRIAEQGELYPFNAENNYTPCYIRIDHPEGAWWARWHGIYPKDWEPWGDGTPVVFAVPEICRGVTCLTNPA